MDWNQQGAPDLSEFGDVYDLKFSLGDDRPPTSDSTLASILLRLWPAALSTARFGHVDDGAKSSVNAVRRVYIKTTNDHMVKPEQQEAMIRRWLPSEVVAMDTDQSPFFSEPERLFELILKSM
ncbi:methylesterase 17-like [Miscanthus floridulus]|uniref:methylesterase 17-like n=1 Tax=Miscanthus floridulus TaxID=154761 RepID=UPI0034573F49